MRKNQFNTEVEIHTESFPPTWDEAICKLGGSVFHSTLWADYQRKTRKVRPVFVLRRDENGEPTGGALLLFRQSSKPIASLILRDVRLPAYPFGNGHDNAGASDLIKRCEALAGDWGCSQVILESFMSGGNPFIPAEHGYNESRRVEFCLDLSRDLDSLWKGIRKDQRERIRRLEKQGIAVEVGATWEDVQGLRKAQEAAQARRSERGQGYELSEDEKFYAGLYEHLVKRGAARLFVARHRGDVIATLFFLTFNGRANSVYSGSTDFGYKVGAQSGLFWTAVEMFKSEGFHELNRGGVPASAESESDPLHGIYLFKLRLGTTPQICRSGVKVLSPARHRLRLLCRRLWR